jgi:methionine--tRNA ligase beta chain
VCKPKLAVPAWRPDRFRSGPGKCIRWSLLDPDDFHAHSFTVRINIGLAARKTYGEHPGVRYQLGHHVVTQGFLQYDVAPGHAPGNHLADKVIVDDFGKVDLRVGVVLTAELVPGADKLLRLAVDLGEERPRNVFAGIRQAYPEPARLVGKRVAVVANLAPRKMKFGVSEGMILAAGPGGADVWVLEAPADAPAGALIK